MDYGGPHLRLDVIAEDGKPGSLESITENLGHKHGYGIHKGTSRIKATIGIKEGILLAAHRKVVNHHICLPLPKLADDGIPCLCLAGVNICLGLETSRLRVLVVLRGYAVDQISHLNGTIQKGNLLLKDRGTVWFGKDCLR